MGTEASARALREGTIYVAFDRFVCARTGCAGYTAAMTGTNIDGQRLRPIDDRDIAEWASYGMGPIRCECGQESAGGAA